MVSRRVFLIGAAGGVGRPLAVQLVRLGHDVTGMHRSPEQAQTIRDLGATPVGGDLITDSVATLRELFVGHDAVVFSAGAHGTGMDKTTAIDGDGLRKAVDAAAEAGVRRFVLVSVFMDALRGGERSDGFEHYMAVKRSADTHLSSSDLDWLIVRPGTLLDQPATESRQRRHRDPVRHRVARRRRRVHRRRVVRAPAQPGRRRTHVRRSADRRRGGPPSSIAHGNPSPPPSRASATSHRREP